MIAREVMAVNEQLGFDHIDLKCLPASYHHHPEHIAPEMDKAIIRARKNELKGRIAFRFTWAIKTLKKQMVII